MSVYKYRQEGKEVCRTEECNCNIERFILQWKVDRYGKRSKKNNSSRDETYEEKSGIHFGRLQNKQNVLRTKYKPRFGQKKRLKKELGTKCKQNAS